jgi:flagellin
MQVGNLSPNGSSVLSSYINGYSGKINKSLERLASGLRVSSPSDSPGDYFKAQSLERRANEVNTIERGMQTHIARVQTADGYLDTASSLLNDMSDLALEASNETDNDLRVNLGKEYDVKYQALKTFVESARFEGEALLTGDHDSSIGASLSVQIDEGTSNTYSYDILDTRIDEATGLNLGTENDAETAWTTQSGAQGYYDAITTEDKGLTRLNRNVNRVNTHVGILEGASSALTIKATNYEAAASSLVSVDDAQETTRLSSMQIRQQAAASFLAQNNMVRANIYSTLSYSSFK